ncbi:MAG: hypothetical protein IPL21_07185 [Saprospirales bacterium]|nr:hypothetical protein [Saprospirales bacterium]
MPPNFTNKTMHTIGENFITINLINAVNNPKYNIIDIKVFPNPFRYQTQIILETNELKNPILN